MDIRYVEIDGRWYIQWTEDIRSKGSFATEQDARDSVAVVLAVSPWAIALMWSFAHVLQEASDGARRTANALAGTGEPREGAGQ